MHIMYVHVKFCFNHITSQQNYNYDYYSIKTKVLIIFGISEMMYVELRSNLKTYEIVLIAVNVCTLEFFVLSSIESNMHIASQRKS